MKRLYFDYNATAPLAPGLSDKMQEWMQLDYKNPSSAHQEGQSARSVIERARRQVLSLLGADQQKLIWTSGGTESNNVVLRSAAARRGSKNKLLLSSVEHACVHNVALDLEKQGVELIWVPVDRRGQIDWDDFKNKLTDDVFLVSVMLVNNETGFVLPVEKMAEMVREKNIPFHTDAVCAVGKWPVNFKDLQVDFLTFSSHKFGGLKGTGGIIVSQGAFLDPLILGGSQEASKRAGTENVYGVLATAYALEFSLTDIYSDIEKQKQMRHQIWKGIQKIYSQAMLIESVETVPQSLNVSFVGLNGNVLLTNLDLEGVSASYGSACASGSLEMSRALLDMKLTLDEARSSIRLSFGKQTNPDDIPDFLVRMQKAVERMI